MSEDREILTDLNFRFHERQVDFREPMGAVRGRGELTVEQILAWADAHHAAHGVWPEVGLRSGSLPVDGANGRWPTMDSGPVAGVLQETWHAIHAALSRGGRGLKGGMTLCRLLAEHRGYRNRLAPPPVTVDQILGWADAHHAIHGRWPTAVLGPVTDAPCETWKGLDLALREGRRGLSGNSSLCHLLVQHRGHRNIKARSRLTESQILAWADAHHAAHGRWPTRKSGLVTAAPGESWSALDGALVLGHRGLSGGSSLSCLLAEHRGYRNRSALPRVTEAQILAWADAYHAAHDRWPTIGSGPVTGAPGETWKAIGSALVWGNRGLSGGSSLSRLLATHRGRRNSANPPQLTVDQILAWADAHHAAHGRWPTTESGAVAAAPGETWKAINLALRKGSRGLGGRTTLPCLLAEHRGHRNKAALSRLTIEQILAWADAHHGTHGRWPLAGSGPVAAAPGERWNTIDQALKKGSRGLEGGTSLARLLDAHRQSRGDARR